MLPGGAPPPDVAGDDDDVDDDERGRQQHEGQDEAVGQRGVGVGAGVGHRDGACVVWVEERRGKRRREGERQ